MVSRLWRASSGATDSRSGSGDRGVLPVCHGERDLIDLYRGYHNAFFLDRCFDLRTHRADDSTVTLEYASEGRAVATGRPYGNHYISVVTIKDRKIIHWRDYLDPLRVFEALGVND